MMYGLDNPLIVLLIAGPWQRSKARSSSGAGGMQFPDFFTLRATRKLSQTGSRISIGSFMFSMYIQLFLLRPR